jgi:hypothetical protein
VAAAAVEEGEAVEEEEAAVVVVRIVSLSVSCYYLAHLLFATLLLPGAINLVQIL